MKTNFPTLALGAASLLFSAGVLAGGGPAGHGQSAAHAQASPPMHSTVTTRTTSSDSTRAPTTMHATGQPNASCEDTPNPPGNSATAAGSPFNPEGRSGEVYAGEQPQNSRNPNSVSQYDAACTRPTH
jgi:hypothetical protein